MTLIKSMYIIFGLLLAALSLPLIARKVKPNPLYGFRIQRTLEDPRLWYAVNAHFGWRMLVIGLVTAAAAIGLARIPAISLDAYALLLLGVFALFFGIGLVQSSRFMNRLEREP